MLRSSYFPAMVRFVNQKLLAVVLAILGASSAFCVDQQLLSDLGGVYDGKYVSGYYELIESGGTTLPIGKRLCCFRLQLVSEVNKEKEYLMKNREVMVPQTCFSALQVLF